MVSLRSLAIGVLVISFFTFVAFFGRLPGLRNTPIGFLHRLLWIHLPHVLRTMDQALTGGRLGPSMSGLGRYVLYEKHFLVTILFLGLIAASASMILFEIWSEMSTLKHLFVCLLLPQPFLFAYLAASVNANPQLHITRKNHGGQMLRYPYDYTLYHPGQTCRTCLFIKPARSKHCSICKACISRADHHCVWVNNCLGRGNYRWFLALLLSTSVLLFYGSYLAYGVLMPAVSAYMAGSDLNRVVDAGESVRATLLASNTQRFHNFIDTLQTAINIGGISVAGVGMLATLTAPLPLGLLAYHAYLIWAGTTTNESGKWSDWREDMQDGVAWMADLKDEGATGIPRSIPGECPWPITSRHCIVQTSDGQRPGKLPDVLAEVVAPKSWRRVWRLAQVENIYDLGFWDNLVHVLQD